jgi:hypothetical protein
MNIFIFQVVRKSSGSFVAFLTLSGVNEDAALESAWDLIDQVVYKVCKRS